MNNCDLTVRDVINGDSPHTLDSLKIISVNTNSLISLNKREELLNFLNSENPDVALICETKLSARYKLQFLNYELIRTDRLNSQKGGGTAILMKRNIRFEQIFFPSSKNNKALEYTIIKTQTANHNLYIVALYANNLEKKIFIDEINTLFSKLDLIDCRNYFVMAGDLNARHWGDTINKTKGTLLKNWETIDGLLYRTKITPPATPTFPSSGSYIDGHQLHIFSS